MLLGGVQRFSPRHYPAPAAEAVVDNAPGLTLGIADDTNGAAALGQTVTYTLTATNRGAATVANSTLSLRPGG